MRAQRGAGDARRMGLTAHVVLSATYVYMYDYAVPHSGHVNTRLRTAVSAACPFHARLTRHQPNHRDQRADNGGANAAAADACG